MPRLSTARFMASRLARRMLRRSISSTLAEAIAQASASVRMRAESSSRTLAERSLESASPSKRPGWSTTAAAKTAPASGPRPASSTPHSSAVVVCVARDRGMFRCPREKWCQRLPQALVVPAGEASVKLGEALLQPLARRLVVQPVAQRLRQIGRRGVLLQELGHDELAGEDVGQ